MVDTKLITTEAPAVKWLQQFRADHNCEPSVCDVWNAALAQQAAVPAAPDAVVERLMDLAHTYRCVHECRAARARSDLESTLRTALQAVPQAGGLSDAEIGVQESFCIRRTHAGAKNLSWCRRGLVFDFAFKGVDHAAEHGRTDGSLLVCKDCTAEVAEALANGWEEPA